MYARRGHGQHIVEPSRGDAHRVLTVNILYLLKQLIDTLSRHRRDKQNRRVGHEGKIRLQLFAERLHRFAVLFNRVPLVDGDNTALAAFMRVAGDLAVLFGKADRRVDHDNAHVAAVDRHICAQHAVPLDLLLDARLAPDAGRIDEHKTAVFVFDNRVDGVARCARHVGDNRTLLARHAVDKRRFANVRLADNGDLYILFAVLVGTVKIDMRITRIEQVAGAVSMHGRHGDRVAEAEVVKLVKIGRHIAETVAFIDRQHHRLAAFLQHHSDVLVGRRHA